MKTILVADIFGKTAALLAIAEELNADAIVDPYDGKIMNFKNEAEAYDYFTNHIGLENYLTALSKEITLCSKNVFLIGFSVGASAIWRLSELTSKQAAKHVKGAVGFYGSQIRNFSKLKPTFEIQLIFPKTEPHFNVQALQNTLSNYTQVDVIPTDYLHGFMNVHSENFNQVGYHEYINKMKVNDNKGSL